jgi:shikimate kinase
LDVSDRPYVVMSGLPASGKSTVGAILARALGLTLLDKDAILEELFAGQQVSPRHRQELSRRSDAIFRELAERSAGAVLVSFWRHPDDPGPSGTPSEWVKALSRRIVEVYCECPASVAEARFRSRVRHPGHNDRRRFEGLAEQFASIARRGPLGIGRLVTTKTDGPTDTMRLIEQVTTLLSEAGRLAKF